MLLLLAGLAAPATATAQTTVTSSGREGPTACLGQEEVNAANFPITDLSTTSITYTTPAITWNEYVGRLGDTPAPAGARIFYEVFGVGKMERAVATERAILSSGGQVESQSFTSAGLSAKTLYYVETAVVARDADNNPVDNIPAQVFARRCFMTGGTYTMNVPPGTEGDNSGCFSISPLTQQDVRNCWCGRKTTLPLFSSTQDNTDLLNRWGCR